MRAAAFLKAINVGGHTVTMERLRAIIAGLGYRDVRTLLASGNVVLGWSGRASPASHERRIAEGLEQTLGYPVPVFLRETPALEAALAAAPFSTAFVTGAQVRNIGFLREPLGKAALARLAALCTDQDQFAALGRELHWASRTRQSESPFFKIRFEREFGTDMTMRTRGTVEKVVAALGRD
jgi:uncharacterized protein (DUF1697 family)